MLSQSHELELGGCAPEPLMAYLKALGVFRLVSEQKDPQARAWWRNDAFFLRSTLDREALLEFFLEEYRPSPIVSPWNKDNVLYKATNSKKKTVAKAMDAILEMESPRFELWRETIETSRRVVDQAERMQWRKLDDAKAWTLAQCRIQFPDDALDWLDAVYVLTSDGAKFPPLFGIGGVEGKLEFSNNYIQNIVSALNIDNQRNGQAVARERLAAALFGEGSPQLLKNRSTGFFNPESVGGHGAAVGFKGDALTNPWDYVLMFEGALLFAGAAARRLSPQAQTKAIFPFTVDNSAGGYGTAADSEYGRASRAEFWAPVWKMPANLRELSQLVSEGRAQLGRRQAATGGDFARAVAGLGIERGVFQFHRYGFFVRLGRSHLASPLGRFRVRDDDDAVERANMLFDLDQWLDRLRGNAAGTRPPAGLGAALRRIDDAIIEFCQRGQPRDLQNVLVAVGYAERWLAKSSIRDKVAPLGSLRWEWLNHANDNSAEFGLARAMASILREPPRGEIGVGAIRENLEPVEARRRTKWAESPTSCVWGAGDPLANMLATLERRCLEGRMRGGESLPLDSAYSARLDHIVAFLNGGIDAQRVAELALPLSFVRYWHRKIDGGVNRQSPIQLPFDLPAAYAAMKLTLLPRKFECPEFGADTEIRHEPAMLSMLRAGRIGDAYELACRRLGVSGLQPLSADAGIADSSGYGRRLAAALLFPLDAGANYALAKRALRPPADSPEAESQLD